MARLFPIPYKAHFSFFLALLEALVVRIFCGGLLIMIIGSSNGLILDVDFDLGLDFMVISFP